MSPSKVEERLARLESDHKHLSDDLLEIKADVKLHGLGLARIEAKVDALHPRGNGSNRATAVAAASGGGMVYAIIELVRVLAGA